LRRWRDEIVMMAGMKWRRRAQQRIEWNALGETFVQQWRENGSERRSDNNKNYSCMVERKTFINF
jgi:hypothetical protein